MYVRFFSIFMVCSQHTRKKRRTILVYMSLFFRQSFFSAFVSVSGLILGWYFYSIGKITIECIGFFSDQKKKYKIKSIHCITMGTLFNFFFSNNGKSTELDNKRNFISSRKKKIENKSKKSIHFTGFQSHFIRIFFLLFFFKHRSKYSIVSFNQNKNNYIVKYIWCMRSTNQHNNEINFHGISNSGTFTSNIKHCVYAVSYEWR